MKGFGLHLLATTFIVAIALSAYHRFVFNPAQRIGVVDVAEVYRAKEAQFAEQLTRGESEEQRQKALTMAREFAQRLPLALDELPRECNCLVVVKSTIVGSTEAVIDMTALLKQKVGL